MYSWSKSFSLCIILSSHLWEYSCSESFSLCIINLFSPLYSWSKRGRSFSLCIIISPLYSWSEKLLPLYYSLFSPLYSWSESFSHLYKGIISSHLCTVGVKAFPPLFSSLTKVCRVERIIQRQKLLTPTVLFKGEKREHSTCTVGVKASPSVLFSLLTFVQLEWKLLPLYYSLFSPLYSWSESFSLCIILSSHLCTVGVKASPSVLFSLLTFVQLEWKLLPLYYSLLSPLYSWSESFSLCIILSSHLCTVGVKASPSVLFSLLTFVQLEWKLLPLYYSLFSPLYSWSKSFSLCIILSSHLCTVGVKASPSVLFSLLTFVQLEWKLLPLYYSLFSPLYSWSEKLLPLYYYLFSPLYSWSKSFSLCIILSFHLCTVGVKASPSVLFSPLTFVQLEWKLLPLYYYLLSPLYSWSESFSLCIILSSHLCTVGVKASPSVLFSPLTFVQLEWKLLPPVLFSLLTFVQLEWMLLPLYYSLLSPLYSWSESFCLCFILSSHLCTVWVKASASVLFSPLTFVQLEWKLLPLYYSLFSPLYSWSESFCLCIILSSHLCTVGVKASASVLFSPLTFVQLEWKLLPLFYSLLSPLYSWSESFSLCIILSSHLCTVGVKASPSVLFSLLTFVQLEWKLLPLYYSLFSPLYSWSESFSLCIILSSHLCTVGVKASPSVLFSLLTFVQLEWKLLPLYYSLFSPLYSWSERFSFCIILSSHLCTVGVKASPSVLFSPLTFVQLEWKLLILYYSLFSPLYSWSESFSLCIILSSHLCTVWVKASPSVLFSPLTFVQLE